MVQVDFTRIPMLMRQPYSCIIRRNFLAGIHVELKQSRHQRSLRAQLHWLQVMYILYSDTITEECFSQTVYIAALQPRGLGLG